MSARLFALTLAALLAAPALAQDGPPASTGPLPNGQAQIAPVTADDLLATHGREWLTYHGDYSGRHWSPLGQIRRDNVGTLRRACRASRVPALRALAGTVAQHVRVPSSCGLQV